MVATAVSEFEWPVDTFLHGLLEILGTPEDDVVWSRSLSL